MDFHYCLTDVDENKEVDTWEISSEKLGMSAASHFRIKKRTLRGGKQEGSTIIEVEAGDLFISVVPTRGMGLHKARYKGVDLGWSSPVDEIVHPAFIHLGERSGLGWLDGFNELMVRCGFEWSGHACADETQQYSLHGRSGNTPASKVTVTIEREAPHRICIKGLLKEKTFKFSDFEIWTSLTITPGQAGFSIADTLENRSDYDRNYQIIYHTNFGKPLLETGSRFVAPLKRIAPFNERAKLGIPAWETYLGPTKGFDEEVFACELHSDASGKTIAALINSSGDLGVAMRYVANDLPAFSLWKNTDTERQGYVTGLEPGTNYPYPRTVEKAHGRLKTIKAGETLSFAIDFQVMTSGQEVKNVVAEIVQISNGRSPVVETEPVFLQDAGVAEQAQG